MRVFLGILLFVLLIKILPSLYIVFPIFLSISFFLWFFSMLNSEKDNNQSDEEEETQSKRNSSSTNDKMHRFLEVLSKLLAYLTKADGVIDQREIESIERVFVKLNLSEENRRFCVNVFRKAKDDTPSEREAFFSALRHISILFLNRDLCEIIFGILITVANADGNLHPAEVEFLNKVSAIMGLGVHMGSEQRRQSYREESDVTKAYRVLGCNSNMTDEEIKKAYKTLVKNNHPDVLIAKGLPKELINKADERMSEINNAYELLKRVRNFA